MAFRSSRPRLRWTTRRYRRVARIVAAATTAVLILSTLPASLPPPRPGEPGEPGTPDRGTTVRGTDGAVTPRGDDPAHAAAMTGPPPAAWPGPGRARVDLNGGAATFGGLTVRLVAPESTREPDPPAVQAAPPAADVPDRLAVEVLDDDARQDAGTGGPLLRLGRDDGTDSPGRARVRLGYGGFGDAFGGDFGSRLRLVRLPDCALTDRSRPECATPQAVASTNDTETDTITADVTVDGRPALFALLADESSSQGSYGATKLSPSSKWSVAPSTGAASWSYPMRTPPVPGGLAPEVTLAYSSQSVDGRTAATNNQGSWIGEGFGYEPGYIERRYKPCSDDGHSNSAEMCWSHHNATIVLAGRSGELVRVNDTEWKLSNDDGSKVERLTGTVNGDNDGEHWRITTSDGTQYFLGLGRLPGWTSGAAETASTWTVPVYGDDTGEPCHGSSFAASSCAQAWRWNLDYVKDRNDNVISYFYERETNHYAKDGRTDVNGTGYDRGGVLKRIDYGQRHNAVYTTNAPARVVFATAERCLPTTGVTCAPDTFTQTNAPHWPDVPYDRYCAPGTKCRLDQASASYWTRKRLTSVTTEIRSGTGWTPVDSWSLTHLFTDNGDGSRTLWLNKIDHKGHVGGATADVPSVELQGRQLDNRIDIPNDNVSPLKRFRLGVVYTDTGAQIDFTYEPADCGPTTLPRPGESTRRCFPVKWNPTGTAEPITDWFNKYVIGEVVESDRTGHTAKMAKRYRYIGDAAWRHSAPDGITEAKYQTWSEWRGYQRVEVTGGDGQTMTTRAEHVFLRGMHGDKAPGGGTRTVTVTDSAGTVHTDHDEFAGFGLENVVYNGTTPVSTEITTPWLHHTATENRPWATLRSSFVRPATVRSITPLSGGGTRETRTVTTFEPTYGRAVQVEDLGDVTTATDDRCTRTEYAENPTARIVSLPARVETVAVGCAAPVNRSTQVLADDRTRYDGQPFGAAPGRGNATLVEKLAAHDGTRPTYETESQGTFDDYGRPLIVKDAAGTETRISYEQTDGLTTKKTETGPLGFETVTEFHPAWGVPTAQVDPNGKRVDMAYDPLGRLTAVWLADRPKATGATPSIRYSYGLRSDAVVAVKVEKLQNDGSYSREYQLFDGHLRPRQVQTEGPDGGRMVADTFYTPTGQIAKTYSTYHAAGTPSDTLLVVDNGDVDGQSIYTYDGADRVTRQTLAVAGDEKWHTTTTYDGEQTHVDPPAGGTRTTTITDARGNVVELRQHKGAGPPGNNHDRTRYTYNTAGQLETVTDPAGNVWRYGYDQQGRKIREEDPDTGVSTFEYDELGNVTAATDARQTRLEYDYDKIGRKTATYQVTGTTRTKLAEWKYDTVAKGYLYTASRFVNGKTYAVGVMSRDFAYRPTRTRYVIPDEAGVELKGSFDFTTAYRPDGSVQSIGMPAAGGLPAEAVVTTYDTLGRATGLTGASPYVTNARYAQTNELQQIELHTGGANRKLWQTWTYEEGTGRLLRAKLDRQGVATADSDRAYRYDDAGNLLSAADTRGDGSVDRQCFQLDHLRRMTAAWTSPSTATDPCAGGPQTTGVGGPDAYHHSYTYDPTGNRTAETVHGIGGAGDVTRTYTYPNPGQSRPHGLTQVVESTPAGDRLYRYGYDDTGNTTSRSGPSGDQTLTWDAEGHLESVTQTGKTTSFVYDADGNRLVRKDPDAVTVYLPGMELRLDRLTRGVTATRYYTFGGATVAVRVAAGVRFLAADHQSTGQAAVDAVTGEISWQRTTPFGGPRGPQAPSWPTDRGFVGGTRDGTTGLIHLGARLYDGATGRFLSVDPVIDSGDPQQMNGYAYGNNNPVTFSDPDGLCYGREEGDFCPGHTRGPWSVAEQDKYVAAGYFKKTNSGRKTGGGGGGNDEAERSRRAAEEAKKKLMAVAKALLKVAMDELGITAALDCFTTGDLGACAETAINVASSLVGGILGKIATKYAAPWKWKKAAELGKKITGLLGDLVGAAKSWFKNSKLAKKGGGGSGGCNSFISGTRVLLANGRSKPIETVTVGDNVIATDPQTGETGPRSVVATIVGSGDKVLVEIAVNTGGDTSAAEGRLVATHNHPFWADERTWVDAIHLRPGMALRTSDGKTVRVAAVRVWWERSTVYNLTVADIHTYHVLAGETPVLVHNIDEDTVCDLTLGPDLNQRAEGISAERGDSVSDAEQEFVNESGDRNGCYSCGADESGYADGHWTGDHNPANKLAPEGPWTLYPHCRACSHRQAGVVTQINRGNYRFLPRL